MLTTPHRQFVEGEAEAVARYPVVWATRVQGRREMAAACSAAKRDGASLLVRLSRASCAPCHRSEPLMRAMLDAVAVVPLPPAAPPTAPSAAPPTRELRVYWLDADDPGSSDVFNFFASRRLCRGVPALFLFRGSEDLYAPDLAQDGAEPYGIARMVARAADLSGPAVLADAGPLAKTEADLAFLRGQVAPFDAAVRAVLDAAEPFLQGVPPPRASSIPANATELVAQAAAAQQQQYQQQHGGGGGGGIFQIVLSPSPGLTHPPYRYQLPQNYPQHQQQGRYPHSLATTPPAPQQHQWW